LGCGNHPQVQFPIGCYPPLFSPVLLLLLSIGHSQIRSKSKSKSRSKRRIWIYAGFQRKIAASEKSHGSTESHPTRVLVTARLETEKFQVPVESLNGMPAERSGWELRLNLRPGGFAQ